MTTKIVAIDDDPTGCQTVHSCLLLTRWDEDTLLEGLRDEAPIFFVLSNTRGMAREQAEAVTREICRNLRGALRRLEAAGTPVKPVVVSRSDSTLRGHYPLETDVIAAELGPFDAHFLVPAFIEGGRITRDCTHYLLVDGAPVPVHETEFARDSVFGYRHSHLPDYVAEKTGGRIPAEAVTCFTLDDLRAGIADRLRGLSGNACCAVDAVEQGDLDRFAADLRTVAEEGGRFLFRSAASLLTSLANLPPQPVAAADMGRLARGGAPGVILAGSHVARTTAQLEHLRGAGDVVPVLVDVERLPQEADAVREEALAGVRGAFAGGRTALVYTSRGERRFDSVAERLAFGEQVSGLLMDVVRGLPEDLGFLVSKGGITSNDVLSHGLALRASRVMGQILPGVSVVRCPDDHPRHPGMPVVIFPGNVGGDDAITRVYRTLAGRASAAA